MGWVYERIIVLKEILKGVLQTNGIGKPLNTTNNSNKTIHGLVLFENFPSRTGLSNPVPGGPLSCRF